MKLRIRGNSIRLRLTKGEVARFGETGEIKETVEFGLRENERLIYALISSEIVNSSTAVFENNQLSVFLPKSEAENWTRANEVGIYAEHFFGNDKFLRITVEKDFACLEERPGEDDADAFPHPIQN